MANMKQMLIVATILTAAMVAETGPAWSNAALPQNKDALLALSDTQLSLLRRAVRHCNDFSQSRHNSNFCVTSAVDFDVRQSGNAELQALHWALAPSERYNETRSLVGLRPLLRD